MLKKRFLDLPGKCSSRGIGHQAITTEGITEGKMTTYKQEKNVIAPWLSKLHFLQGNRRVPFVILIVAQITEIIYIVESIKYGSSAEVSSILLVSQIIICIAYIIINYTEVKAYLAKASVWTKAENESSFTGSTFLVMYGLDTSIRLEDDLRNGEGPNKHRELRNKMTRDSFLLSFFCIFMPAILNAVPFVSYSFKEHYDAKEWVLMCLCVGTFISRGCIAVSSLTVSFCVLLAQSVHIFELKKLQHDIRNCTIEEIPLIFPRLKNLLLEIHQVCNMSYIFFYVYFPIIVSSVLMLLTSIFNLNVAKNENYQVPVWILVSMVVPLFPVIAFYVGYASINRITERDIDEDLNDLELRLQFAVGHDELFVRNNSDKLKNLIRGNSRVCILPFHIIPDPTTAKQLMSYFVSACIVFAPYIVAMKSQLIWGYLSTMKTTDGEGDAGEL